MADKTNVISGCYERFVLGHQVRQAKGVSEGSGGNVGEARLRQSFSVKAHQGPVRCVCSKGGLLASGGDDDCVRIFDLNNGKDLGTLVQHEGTVTSLDMYHAEGVQRPSHLFSAGKDGIVNVWRVKDFRLLSKLRGHKKGVKSIAVHPSGKIAFTSGDDCSLIMWNLIKGRISYKTKLETPYDQILFHPTHSKFVARAGRKIVVRSLDGDDAVPDVVLESASDSVSMTCPGLDCVLSGQSNGHISLWDLRSAKPSHDVKAHNVRVKGVVVSYDIGNALGGAVDSAASAFPTYFTSASSAGDIKLWDTRMLGGSEVEGELANPLTVTQTGVRITCLCPRTGEPPQSVDATGDSEQCVRSTSGEATLGPSTRESEHAKDTSGAKKNSRRGGSPDREGSSQEHVVKKMKRPKDRKKRETLLNAKLKDLKTGKPSQFD
eukprot:CAMPEP_0198234600 /NCGR_PEP_ID=MMETSP1446-20131203/587_1 /TAXON_ID=1461542 ORGANISM="Unidentified sp, Strain CCMP2111" /NCGR_SAMPLE_ID=MMETSP1446 /ASSEMBLY_ACC=CAM_ASM_001112 /LENGTH=433 /DNA_ID=CAMNT_0043915405 /DNA_START=279 /DNA_END=1580 /DNA_ORIENTATION=-